MGKTPEQAASPLVTEEWQPAPTLGSVAARANNAGDCWRPCWNVIAYSESAGYKPVPLAGRIATHVQAQVLVPYNRMKSRPINLTSIFHDYLDHQYAQGKGHGPGFTAKWSLEHQPPENFYPASFFGLENILLVEEIWLNTWDVQNPVDNSGMSYLSTG